MENIQHFEKILIAVDESKYAYHATEYGFAIAQKLGAKVALVHINEMPIATNITGDPILGDPGMILPNIMDIQRDRAKELMTKLKQEFGIGDAIIEEYILDGDITHEIVTLAKEQNISLIVMGTHGRTGFDHFISGSIAESVTRHAKCPVLIVPSKD